MRRVRRALAAALETAGMFLVSGAMYVLIASMDDLLALLAP